jgi:DNA-binding beta-propeller fold protein YncE
VKLRPGLLATISVLCIAAGAARAQYVEDSIDVGGSSIGGLVYNSREDVLYGRCQLASIFFAISCDSNKVINAFSLSYPRRMAYDSIDNKAYCTYAGTAEESLAVIDGRTHMLTKKIRMPGAMTPIWDQVSNCVYVSCPAIDGVMVVDCVSDSLLASIPVSSPVKMYINTLRHKLYILDYGVSVGAVSIVNMTTNQVTGTVEVGEAPDAGYYCRSQDKFYSGGLYSQSVAISGESDTIVSRIPVVPDGEVLGVTGNEDDGLVYFGSSTLSDDYLAIVSAQTDSVLRTVDVGREPYGLAYYHPSGLLYCASAMANEVRVLTSDGSQTLTTLHVGEYPYAFVTVPHHDRLYLGHLNGRYVYVLRDTSAGIAESQSPQPGFRGVSVTPNPFTRNAAVIWNSPLRRHDVARVYAQDGRLVRQTRIPAGEARWVWDGRDGSGVPLPPGVYMLEAGPGVRAKVVKLE